MAKTTKSTSRRPAAAASAGVIGAASALLGAGAAHALAPGATPQGATVVGGSANVAQAGSTVTVNQSSNRAVIDWRSFDIGSDAHAVFNQPNASAIAVNRVNASTDPTRIEGSLTANGQVWILNPNGVLFGKTATVNVAGLMASTANIDPTRFMAGDNRLTFTGADHGSVANEGQITIAEGGLAAFVAPSVRNSGVINARVGKVTLAAGTTFTLDLAGDGLVELGLGSDHAVVDQSGKIVDAGGVVTLTARSAGQVVDSVINMSGVIDASSATASGGQIVLGADDITTAANAVMKADGAGAGGQIIAVADKTGDYAGVFSARGGALGGDGGHVETSGAVLHIADNISVDTTAANGQTGGWTLDPDTLTVGVTGAGSINGSINSDADQTIAASTVVTALNTTNVTLQAKTAITVNTAIDASGNSTAHNLALVDEDGGGLTVNLNKAITLKSGGVLSGQATTVNLTSGALIQNGNDVALAGATVNLAAGLYAPGATLTKSNLTLAGAPGAEIDVNPGSAQVNAVTIGGATTGVTVKGLTIDGEITGSYVDYAFGSGVSRGIAVLNGATNFTLTGNTITNVRNGILIDGRNTGSVTNNLIDNTKSAISVQYTDATGINIANNSQGSFGNEWGLNLHLNGIYNGTTISADPTSGTVLASSATQTALLADSAANGGWSVQDLAYTGSNRTSVVVATNGSATNQGSLRAPLSTIQAGIAAVVAGGVVNVQNGTYVIPAGGANYLYINKPLSLIGQSEAGVIIDARGASTYGLRIKDTSNVNLSNFTLWGVTSGVGYGIKAENVGNLSIADVTSQGSAKSEFDLNGVIGATLDHLTANGAAVVGGASTAGNGIAFTDSQNITLTNSTTLNNAWGGLALYQSNFASGYTYQETGITVDGTNTFNEANPIYAEKQSTIHDFGTLNISGFGYLVKSPTNPSDVYTWFQRTAQNAIDFAAGVNTAGGATAAYVEGYGSGVTGNNQFTVGVSTGGQALSIQAAINGAQSGATVNVLNGTYVIPAGGGSYLGITKSLSLIGQSQSGVIIDARHADTYGLRVLGTSNVNLSNFTVWGVSSGVGYGVKIEGTSNLSIANVTSQGAAKSEFDFNGVLGATLDHLTANGAPVAGGANTGGNGISFSDSQNITLTNSTTLNNGWGGLALYQTNSPTGYAYQETGITVDGTNTFNEASPVYAEKTSSTNDFGTLNISGFGYLVKSPTNPSDVYTWFQRTAQNAIDFAAAQSPGTAYVEGYGSGVMGNNQFTVGVSTGGQALSIQAAINGAQSGATVNVLNGTYATSAYANGYLSITKSLSLVGQSQSGVVIDARNANTYGLRVLGTSNVNLANFTVWGVSSGVGYGVKIEGTSGLTIANVTSRGAAKSEFDLNGVLGASLDHLTANGAPVAGGANTGGNGVSISDSQNITLTNSTTLNNGWGGLALYQTNAANGYAYQETGITVDGSNSFGEASPVYAERTSSTHDFGTLNIAGFGYLVKSPTNPSDVYTWFQRTAQNAIDFAAAQSPSTAYVVGYGSGVTGNNHFTVGFSTGGQALSIQNAVNAASNGAIIDIASGTYGQSVTSGVRAAYNLGQVSLTGGFTLQAGASGSSLSGALTAGSINLGAPVTLAGNLSLASSGAITTGAIDASTAGGQALTVNGGSVSLGSLGSATQLASVQVSGPTTLTGAAYNAGSLNFGGALTLASNASLTSSGSIVTGTIDGGSAGGQALTINGGSVSLGSLGAGTGLGAVQVSGPATLTGSAYDANSLAFGGDVTLTAATTTFNTSGAAGNITVSGNVFGSSNGAQNLILVAGPGTGSANGDISLQSVGVLGLALGDLTISGRNFNAQTVRVGNFKSTLAGNQVFSSHTLDAGGSVDANVAGDASGPINASGAVNANVGGALSGAITSGGDVSLKAPTVNNVTVTTPGAVNVGGDNVSGVFTGASVKLAATGNVSGTVNASTVSVQAPKGAVTGTWQNLDTGSGGGVLVNNQPVSLAASGANPQQLVVENFTLPAGTTVTPRGQLILPQGVMLGLLSPAGSGGAPKLIQVQSVQELGSLLSQGYTGIIIDLSSGGAAGGDGPQKLSQN